MEKKPSDIGIRYSKEVHSNYSVDTSWINCHTMTDCWSISSGNTNFDDYNPCIDGFQVTSIEVCKQKWFEIDLQTNTYVLDHKPDMGNDIFLASLLSGFESGNKTYLILAVALKENQRQIHWFKDNVEICTGINLNVLNVKDSGKYTCGVYSHSGEECKVLFPELEVSVEASDNVEQEVNTATEGQVDKELEPIAEQTSTRTSTGDIHVCLQKESEPVQMPNIEHSLRLEKGKRHSEGNCDSNASVPAKKKPHGNVSIKQA